MKKLVKNMVFAAAFLLPMLSLQAAEGKTFAYFYTEEEQEIDSPDPDFNAVAWDSEASISSRNIFLSSSDPTQIVLQECGVYAVTYIVTSSPEIPESVIAQPEEGVTVRFALLLNQSTIIPGSIYGTVFDETFEAEFPVEALSGQVIFCVQQPGSTIQLVNDGQFDVELADILGPDDEEDSVTASILIEKLR